MTEDAQDLSYIPVLPLDVLRARTMRAVNIGPERVLLIAVGDGVRAYRNRCPHRAWPLERGTLHDDILTCANHRWAFDVVTGQGVDPVDCALVSFPWRIDDDGMVCVAVPPPR